MSFLDRLERRWGWIAFPGFLRYYAMLHVMVFIIQWLRPDIGVMQAFDRKRILDGEVWRLVTMFFAGSMFGGINPVSVLLLFFAVSFVFMVNDGLEGAWGSFNYSVFCYTGIVTIVLLNFFYPVNVPLGGSLMYASAFLAFATLFPRVEILLMVILPVKVRFLGILTAGALLVLSMKVPILFPYFLISLTNYFIWARIPTLRGTARVMESGKRRRRFNAAKMPASEAFHTCKVCGKTDVTDPHGEFRIGKDGEEYCAEHLPE